MKIAVASGKGGTGKTTVSVNLAQVSAVPVQLVDCDVEAPNCHLFLSNVVTQEEVISTPIPQVDVYQCDGCGECSRFCVYHAIASIGTKPLVFSEMCHSCGGCLKVCPKKAIHEIEKRIGVINTAQTGNIRFVQGCLDVGIPMAPPMIRAVQKRLQNDIHTIVDAPPGTSCPVIAAVRDADYVVLVTEPTPFGLHDLRLAVEMVKALDIPFGMVINRMGIGDDRVHQFCKKEKFTILLEIPDDRRIAEAYSRGRLVVDALPEYCQHFKRLLKQILNVRSPQTNSTEVAS